MSITSRDRNVEVAMLDVADAFWGVDGFVDSGVAANLDPVVVGLAVSTGGNWSITIIEETLIEAPSERMGI